ncbi:unnamed protein product, partial [Rangifer tarandus platyrhynchus]
WLENKPGSVCCSPAACLERLERQEGRLCEISTYIVLLLPSSLITTSWSPEVAEEKTPHCCFTPWREL